MGNETSTPDTWIDQEIDPEIEHIRELMRAKDIAVLTAYPPANKDDFIVGYVEKEYHRKNPTDTRFNIIQFPSGFQIVKESIGDVFNYSAVALYLNKTFPQKTFKMPEVELTYYIMSILLQKSTHIECMDDNRADFCYDDSGKKEGKNSYLILNCNSGRDGRRGDVSTLLSIPIIFIPCYGLDLQDDETVDFNTLPQYRLIELLQDKQKLRIFFDFWRTIPDYGSIYRILHKGLYFPPNIANYIISLAAKKYGKT